MIPREEKVSEGLFIKKCVITETCTGATQDLSVHQHLALVDDLLPTVRTMSPEAGPADDLFESRLQGDLLEGKQLGLRHELVALELGIVARLQPRRVGKSALAHIRSDG